MALEKTPSEKICKLDLSSLTVQKLKILDQVYRNDQRKSENSQCLKERFKKNTEDLHDTFSRSN